MKDYEKSIKFLAANSEDFEFTNKGAEHASIVLVNMLNQTEDEFLMFSGTFNSDVADQDAFLFALERYLESGKKFKLLLEEEIKKESKAFKLFKKYAKKDGIVEFKQASQDFINEVKDIFEGNILHFAVSDSKRYRLETDKENFKAIGNFNDPQLAQSFKDLFEDNYR